MIVLDFEVFHAGMEFLPTSINLYIKKQSRVFGLEILDFNFLENS